MMVLLALVRILTKNVMSKYGFKDEVVLIKLIVLGVVKHVTVTINELGPVDYQGSNRFL
jgi:hypothetical protein